MSKTLNIHTKRQISFKTVETATAWVVFAILIEQSGDETIVSEPRIYKVIPKNTLALTGSCGTLSLSGSTVSPTRISQNIVSPYTSLFSQTDSGILAWFGAQPPTRSY